MNKVNDSDSDDENKQPERVLLAELKTRGKKAAVPIVRTGAAIKCKHKNEDLTQKAVCSIFLGGARKCLNVNMCAAVSSGLSLRAAPVEERSSHSSNSKVVIFDENKASAVPSESKFEPWLAPPPARAKENEKAVEKWCDVKVGSNANSF